MPKINVEIDGSGATKGAAKVRKALSSIASKAGSIASKAFTPLNAAIATIGAGVSITGLAKVADQYTIMASQLEFVTGSAQAAADAQEQLRLVSKGTGTQMEDNAGTLVKLQQASALTGLSLDQNIKVIGGLNALMVKTGTSGAQASTTMLQLSQALTSGKLAGDEFRSMAENAPGVLNRMSESMGIARSDLKAMAAAGELTSDRLGKALLEIAESGDETFSDLPKTAAKGWNAVVLAFETAWDKINDETGIIGFLADALINLADWIENNTHVFVGWFESMVNSAQSAWPSIQEFFTGTWNMMNNVFTYLDENKDSFLNFFSGMVTVVKNSIDSLRPLFEWLVNRLQDINKIVAGAGAFAGTLAGGGGFIDAINNSGEAAQNPFGAVTAQKSVVINNNNLNMGKGQIADLNRLQQREGSRL